MRICFWFLGGFLSICERLLMGGRMARGSLIVVRKGMCIPHDSFCLAFVYARLSEHQLNRYINLLQLVAVGIFLCFNFVIMLPSPQMVRHLLITVKAILSPVALFGLLGWMVGDGRGHSLSHTLLKQVEPSL